MTDEISKWLGEALELHRVIPVVREFRNKDGSRTVVASLEIWNKMLVVRCTTVVPDLTPLSEGGTRPLRWDCRDDVDTTYQPGGFGGAGGERYWTEWSEFRTVPPAHAGRLFLTPRGMPPEMTIEVEL